MSTMWHLKENCKSATIQDHEWTDAYVFFLWCTCITFFICRNFVRTTDRHSSLTFCFPAMLCIHFVTIDLHQNLYIIRTIFLIIRNLLVIFCGINQVTAGSSWCLCVMKDSMRAELKLRPFSSLFAYPTLEPLTTSGICSQVELTTDTQATIFLNNCVNPKTCNY